MRQRRSISAGCRTLARLVVCATVPATGAALLFAAPVHAIWFDGTNTPTPASQPDSVAVLDGAVWFTETAAGKVAKWVPGQPVQEFPLPTLNASPHGITAGPIESDPHALYFMEFDKIGRIDATTNTITETTLPTPSADGQGVTVGPDSDLWFTETAVGKIGTMTPCDTNACPSIQDFPVPTTGAQPFGIAAGHSATPSVWFTERGVSKVASADIACLETAGSTCYTETSVTAGAQPFDITPGPGSDQHMWFTEHLGNSIGCIPDGAACTGGTGIQEYVIPTKKSAPFGIVAAPDNTLYFTEQDGNKIGHITTTGEFRGEFTIPTAAANPISIAGPLNGNLYFTENAVSQVGSVGVAESGYVLDQSGGLHPWGVTSAPPLSSADQANFSWPGANIARSFALRPDARSGYVMDLYGVLHAFGGAPDPGSQASHNWSSLLCDCAKQVVLTPAGNAGYVLDLSGGLHPFAMAGGTMPNPGDQSGHYWRGQNVARGVALDPADASGNSGWVLDFYGGLHAFGASLAPLNQSTFYWPGQDNVRAVVASGPGVGYVLDLYGGLHGFRTAAGQAVPNPGDQSGHYWPGSDIARGVMVDQDNTGGYVLDYYGGLHAWGTAGAVADQSGNYFPPNPIARTAAGLG